MDLKYALRSLRNNPAFTLLALLVMALGIGANTAVFSVVRAVLLKPLAYRDPDRIVTLSSLWKKSATHGPVSAPDFHDWHAQNTAFAAMAFYADDSTAVRAGSAAEYAQVAEVTPEFFKVFAVAPAVGRWFSAEEERTGSGVLVSYSYWQIRYGGSSRALGQPLRMLDKSFTIVGVLPPGFQFPHETDIWFPANTVFPETTSRSAHNYLVLGRLKPGVSLEQAQAQMTAIGARLEEHYPGSNAGKSVAVTRMRDEMVRNVRLTLYLLLGAVGLVLLIGCANVANLLLARATARTREIAIRAAVGAGRGRIVRQLVTESLVLSLMAGAAGLLLARWGSDALVALAPGNVPRLAESGIDSGVLLFTLALSVAASLLFGLAPAVQASRVDLSDALKQGAGRAMAGGKAARLRGALVVAEVALSVVLLAGAGLLIRSFIALHNVALGFHPEHVLVMESSVPASDLEGARRATRFYQELLADLSALPGVTAVGGTRTPPGTVTSNGGYWIDHLPDAVSASAPNAVFSVVTPGAFATLGIPLRRGRDFRAADQFEAPFTAVINEALVRQSFPGQDPLGRVIYCGLDSMKPMTIVGVVGDVRQVGPASEPTPEIYMPFEQHPQTVTALNVLVRTQSPGHTLWRAIEGKVRQKSAEVPVKFTSMEELLSANTAAPRFRTLLLGIFAGIALCLAIAGVYGVMAYAVNQRAGEIGLRMALGAAPADVLGLILKQGLTLAGIGLATGLAAALAFTRLVTSMLFAVKPSDPLTYAGVTVLLGAVALAATIIPAWRAMHLDPVMALRQE
jgi:predicted permease